MKRDHRGGAILRNDLSLGRSRESSGCKSQILPGHVQCHRAVLTLRQLAEQTSQSANASTTGAAAKPPAGTAAFAPFSTASPHGKICPTRALAIDFTARELAQVHDGFAF